jgi:hypothetical protein
VKRARGLDKARQAGTTLRGTVMTSETKRAANRRNAARSTGPRSAAGKKRARQNALRHGLAISLRQDPATWAEIERMAKLICGDGASRLEYELALVRAESEILLRRARMARVAVIERATKAAHVHAGPGQPRARPGRVAGIDAATAAPTEIEALRQALPQIVRLERYVRPAFLRGDRAARRLAAISWDRDNQGSK